MQPPLQFRDSVVLPRYSNSKSTAGYENTEQFSPLSSNRWPPPPACPHLLTLSLLPVSRRTRRKTASSRPHRHSEAPAMRAPHHPHIPRPQRDPHRTLMAHFTPQEQRGLSAAPSIAATTATPSPPPHHCRGAHPNHSLPLMPHISASADTAPAAASRPLWTPLTPSSPDCRIVATCGHGLNHRNKGPPPENLRGRDMTVLIPPRPDKTRSGESLQPQASRSCSIQPPDKELDGPDPQ